MSKKTAKNPVVTIKSDDGKNKKDKPKSDAAAKILSIIAAIILWFYVIDVQTTQYETNFYGIPVELENFNSDRGLDIISGRDSKIDVVLRGTKAQINALSESDIKACVDMSSVSEAGDYKLNVSVSVPSGITVIEKSVDAVEIDIDKSVGKTIPIELSMTYTLPDSYEFGEISLSQKNIYISGPQDLIDSVTKGKVRLDLGNVENKVTAKCSVVLVDAGDNEISSPYIKKSETTVDVTVPVIKTETKRVSVRFVETDLDYNYTVTPSSVNVKGEIRTVEAMESVDTEPLEVIKSGVTTVRLLLPSDVLAYDGEGNLISTVTVTVSDVKDKTAAESDGAEVKHE